MSRYTVVNLREVDDSVGDRAPGIEGRFARKDLESRDLGVSLWRYAPNLRGSTGHSHRQQEEAYVVVSGSGRILLDNETHPLGEWDVIRVAPEVVRAFEAGPDGPRDPRRRRPSPGGGGRRSPPVTWPEEG